MNNPRTPRRLAMRRVVTATAIAATLALTGCSGGVTDPVDALDSGMNKGRATQVTADAQKIATFLTDIQVNGGAYPATMTPPPMQLTGANRVQNYSANATGFGFCVVNPTSGAWALWNSASTGLVGSGTSGATCA